MRTLLLVFLAVGCTGGGGGDDTGGPADGTLALEPTVTVSPHLDTVITVSWTTDEPGTGWVEFGPTGQYGFRTAVDDTESTTHEVVVAGFAPNATWHWRAVSEVGGEKLVSRDATHDTSAPPQGVPAFAMSEREVGSFQSGFRLFPTIGSDGWILVLNDDGKAVWWYPVDEGLIATQARLAADGTSISFLVGDPERAEDLGEIITVSLDQEQVDRLRTPWAHHDFIEIPGEDKWAYIYADFREDGRYTVVGDTIVEIPKAGGDTEAIWSTWDHLPVEYSPGNDVFYPGAIDWTHANTLVLDGDDYYLSLHNTNGMVKLSRSAGETEWIMGGPLSEFEFLSRSEGEWAHQHGFKLIGDDEFVLFDNGSGSPDDYSEVARYRFDTGAMTYEQVWDFEYNQQHVSYLMGDIQPLANGNYYTSWGSEGEILEVDGEGAITWRASASIGTTVAFSTLYDTMGGRVE